MSSPTQLVVDVGNTRIKWGLCDTASVVASAALPPDDPAAWQRQLDAWRLGSRLTWTLGGVHPARRDRLGDWLRQRGDHVKVLASPAHLPLQVALLDPEKAGIDRLLNAVAATPRPRA